MRILFMGSAELACPSLDAVLGGPDELAAVVTQPDRPRGRHLQTAPCAARAHALARGATVLTPPNVNAPESLERIAALRPDLIVIVAYGQLLKPPLLAIPPRGCVNVHPSLLPAYRGAAPIQWAIANGDRETGVTTMRIDARMDAGDIILQRALPIDDADTGGSLHDRLALEGARLLAETLDALREGRATFTPQDDARATYAPKLSKTDGRIDWTLSAAALYNRVRAFNPYPCCFAVAPDGRRLQVLRARAGADADAPRRAPGEIIAVDGDGPRVQTGGGTLCLVQVQPESGKAMTGAAYARGRALRPGDRMQ